MFVIQYSVLFNVLINDLEVGLEGVLNVLADDKLRGAVDSIKGGEALQRDLGKLEGYTVTICMKVNNSQGRGKTSYAYGLGDEMLEHSLAGRDLGAVVNGMKLGD